MTYKDVWSELSLYESVDLLKKYFQLKHRRELNTGKSAEISAHFIQAKEYFNSAYSSDEIIKPLLQYYGVLALTRGLILFNDTNMREASLQQSHGLSATGWNSVLANKHKNALQLSVSANVNGTFRQLMELLGDTVESPIIVAPYPNEATLSYRRPTIGVFSITLRDLLSRIPDLTNIYEQTFFENSNCFEGSLFVLSPDTQSTVHVFGNASGLINEGVVRAKFNVPNSTDISLRRDYFGNYLNYPAFSFQYEHQTIDDLLPFVPSIERDKDNRSYFIMEFPENFRVGYMAKLFMLSYFLSMLVRYNPTYWLSLRSRSIGDGLFSILKFSSTIIQNLYPKMVVRELRRQNRP